MTRAALHERCLTLRFDAHGMWGDLHNAFWGQLEVRISSRVEDFFTQRFDTPKDHEEASLIDRAVETRGKILHLDALGPRQAG